MVYLANYPKKSVNNPIDAKDYWYRLGNMKNKKQYRETKLSLEEALYFAQHGDEELQNYLLIKYQPFIAKSVYQVCKRYIDPKVDDEFSVGLLGFYEAMLKYSPAKGASFFSFANVVIKRKVIDYIRYVQKEPLTSSLNEMDDEGKIVSQHEVKAATEVFLCDWNQWLLKEEMKQFQKNLACYQICIKELMASSPKHKDARHSAVHVARTLYGDEYLNNYVQTKKKLPIKLLLKKVSVSKKTLERQRKFILAIFIVLHGDYLYLQDYIKGIGL
ncbi:RNA polymerase sigma-I factor [Virgibacillus sp. W0181]|uniref:RNA polymerase sigma-I factor n=1 Tax=Virgibacillus sp. W0181 TaxID=3391581 RepID=UPI003F461F3B